MRIALISLDQIWENKEANLKKVDFFVNQASTQNCDLVIFPEMTLTGFSMNLTNIQENETDSFSIQEFQKISDKYNIIIIAGVVFQEDDKATNNSLYVVPNKKVIRYSKIHPFSFAQEDKYYIGGSGISVVKFGELTIGMTICYDLRFPELYSILAQTCQVIVNIANWPKKRVDHWYTLLKARAIEQQVFIIGVNRTGNDVNGNEYEKSSVIYNANGEKLKPDLCEDEIDVYEIYINQLNDFKKTFSTRHDRKQLFYKKYY